MNGWASILSTIAGAALFFGKKNADNGNGSGGGTKNTSTKTDLNPVESSYQEYKQKVEEAQQERQNTDPRNNAMYFGDKTAPYDAFYDFSSKFESVYSTEEGLVTDTPANACRCRIIAPFILSEEVKNNPIGENSNKFVDGGFVTSATAKGYRTKLDQANIDGKNRTVRNSAEGEFRYVTFYVEIFNPCLFDAELQMLGVSGIKIGDTRCQPIHLVGNTNRLDSFLKDPEKPYMYDFANAYNSIWAKGNEGFFAARELRVEPFTNGTQHQYCKWMEMDYPFMLCDNIAYNGYYNQDWDKIYMGDKRVGWGGTENPEYYKPNYLKVPPRSSSIVKITLPLASIDDTKVYYAYGNEIYRTHTVGSDVLKFDYMRENNLFKLFTPSNLLELMNKPNVRIDNQLDAMTAIAAYFASANDNDGVYGYMRYSFAPAPSLKDKIFSIRLTLAGKWNDYVPKADPVIRGEQSSKCRTFDLKLIPGTCPANLRDEWHYSYYDDRTIPDESVNRETQFNIIKDKLKMYDFEETFDPNNNN